MTVVESIIAAIERIVLPQLQRIEADVKVLRTEVTGLRELMEVKFKHIEDLLALDRRIAVVEQELDEKRKAS